MYSYLKRRKQGVRINDTESVLQVLLSVIPQGSLLGPMLFNIFINDLYLFIKDVELANFANDKGKSAIDWFKMNNMIVNPDKFQAMIMSCDKKENKHD